MTTIEQLERDVWPDPGPDATSLVRRCTELRRKPLAEFTVDGVEVARMMVSYAASGARRRCRCHLRTRYGPATADGVGQVGPMLLAWQQSTGSSTWIRERGILPGRTRVRVNACRRDNVRRCTSSAPSLSVRRLAVPVLPHSRNAAHNRHNRPGSRSTRWPAPPAGAPDAAGTPRSTPS
ncbi:hypothetical protein D7I43_08745 [Micromonospora globbae]|uniref:Uncharacterized protein n=1 Tax=Micromonospora globbae TaxID=1894969 RepID=A0A420F4C5_9ACTN|nr:hypothetical protein D7I43_08745 [Micromonospora globbae]